MTAAQTRTRMYNELETLEALTAEAPETHPARMALAKLRSYLPIADNDWLELHEAVSVQMLCNLIHQGSVPGICKPW